MVCRLLLSLSRRGRLRAKLGSASWTGSRRGGDGESESEGGGEVDACSSAAGSCFSTWSWALMTARARVASGAEAVFAQAQGLDATVGRYRQQRELQVQPYERAGAACGMVERAGRCGTMGCSNSENAAQ
jgi:hypothetical protein